MKYSSLILRAGLVTVVSSSLLCLAISSGNARMRVDSAEDVPMHAPEQRERSGKVFIPPLPPGVPGGRVPIPVPVPSPPVVVEKHRYVPTPPESWSKKRERRDEYHSRDKWVYPSHGSYHRHLPVDVFTFSLGAGSFFYHSGVYYQRHSNGGYVVVSAPLGARVRSLPVGCSTLYLGDRRYFSCNNVYYEPYEDEYIVIERPAAPTEVTIEEGDEVRITADSLNVRSGPGTRYQVISKLFRGDIVEVGGKEPGWYYISLSNGQYGWIMREHVKLHRKKYDSKG